MPTFTFRSTMPTSAQRLFDWHARPAAFSRLQPPWEKVRIVSMEKPFGDGHRVVIRANILGPITKDWHAELYDVVPGQRFRDRQLHGPFAEWNHTHSMISDGEQQSILEDHIDFRLPLSPLSYPAQGMIMQRLQAMFAYRHWLTRSDLLRHGQFFDQPRLTVAITGSTGLVGSALCQFLAAGGHCVIRLVRKETPASAFLDGSVARVWNPEVELEPSQLEGVDAVVHLAGENVAARRWSTSQKARIRDSRTGPTARLATAIARLQHKPRVFISASATGIYGHRGDEECTESSKLGSGFLASVCQDWEAAAEPARQAGVRVVHPRIGIVLSPQGGALAKQLPAFRFGGGAVLGDGRQWISWITLNDLVGVLHHLLMHVDISGPVNCVSPEPVTNRLFGRHLARVLWRPYLLTVPRFMLRIMFGEMVDDALLSSTRVVPTKLLQAGFHWDHTQLEPALKNMLGR